MPEISLEHLLDLVKGQERVEAKLDGFLATQKAHDDRLTKLEGRVDAVEDDITDLKAQRSSDFRVIGVLGFVVTSVAGGILFILQAIGWSGIKVFLKP